MKNESASEPHRLDVVTQAGDQGAKKVEDGADITKRRVQNDYSSYKPICIEPGKEQIRLLQILPPEDEDDEDEEIVCCLFNAPPTADRIVYIALSYCWGDMAQQRTIKLMHHSFDDEAEDDPPQKNEDGVTLFAVDKHSKISFNVTESLYQALKSLRASRSQLSEQFPILDHQPLWVDALCINQSNISERNSQVRIMRSIYSKAMFVFIWMGEDKDVIRGINLIVGLVRLLREKHGKDFDILDLKNEQIEEVMFMINYDFGDENLGPEGCLQVLERFFNNQYFRRIWVLQEATCNAESTFIHITGAQVAWAYILVAERFCRLRQKAHTSRRQGALPAAWTSFLHERLRHVRDVHRSGTSHGRENCEILGNLYPLFKYTEEFQASDPRDKLYALLDFAQETRRGMKSRDQLAPDYNTSPSEVFSKFTVWCIRYTGNLEVLSLLARGPRRILLEDFKAFNTGEGPPEGCLDARCHPSWALWPTPSGSWSQSSLALVSGAEGFDLASEKQIHLLNLATHPTIRVPGDLSHRFLSLGGQRISTVKSVMRMPLKCVQSQKTQAPWIKKRWFSDEIQEEMDKYPTWHSLSLAHPYNNSLVNGSIVPLWALISKPRSPTILVGNSDTTVVESQEWLGKEGGRYQGKNELMFRDFLETLLLSPVYRGTDSLNHNEETLPDGPWNDGTIATSFAMFWAEHEPTFKSIPSRITELLKEEMFDRKILQSELFPFLCQGVGKCFFITEDERMGLCPPDTRPGDIVVALFGSSVPFVVRPVKNEDDFEGDGWDFEDCGMLRDQLFRFIGECYVHERMTSSFLAENESNLGPMEVFNLW